MSENPADLEPKENLMASFRLPMVRLTLPRWEGEAPRGSAARSPSRQLEPRVCRSRSRTSTAIITTVREPARPDRPAKRCLDGERRLLA